MPVHRILDGRGEMMRITVTCNECLQMLREAGMKISAKRLVDGFQDGSYPFGRVISVGDTGRRRCEIFAKDVREWIESKTA